MRPASPLPEPHELLLALFPLTFGKFNAHVVHQRLRFTHDIPRRLARADRALCRKKSRRAFHLERTRCVRFNQTNPTRRQPVPDEPGFRPQAIIPRDELETPLPLGAFIPDRRKKIQQTSLHGTSIATSVGHPLGWPPYSTKSKPKTSSQPPDKKIKGISFWYKKEGGAFAPAVGLYGTIFDRINTKFKIAASAGCLCLSPYGVERQETRLRLVSGLSLENQRRQSYLRKYLSFDLLKAIFLACSALELPLHA